MRRRRGGRSVSSFPKSVATSSVQGPSGKYRINGRLKDEFGGRHVRVRGFSAYDKVLAHLMFGMTVLTASQLMRLIVPPI